jgi:CheY-like chemotaxis protein
MPALDTPARTLRLLLIEDNPADIELTRQCFQESQVPTAIESVLSGDAALAYLRRDGQFAEAPRPDLVLLDLNLPGIDGREVLAAIKTDPQFKTIPVIILTTSDADSDVREAYRLQANSYFRKPLDLQEFLELADTICRYWSRAAMPTPQVQFGQSRF